MEWKLWGIERWRTKRTNPRFVLPQTPQEFLSGESYKNGFLLPDIMIAGSGMGALPIGMFCSYPLTAGMHPNVMEKSERPITGPKLLRSRLLEAAPLNDRAKERRVPISAACDQGVVQELMRINNSV